MGDKGELPRIFPTKGQSALLIKWPKSKEKHKTNGKKGGRRKKDYSVGVQDAAVYEGGELLYNNEAREDQI